MPETSWNDKESHMGFEQGLAKMFARLADTSIPGFDERIYAEGLAQRSVRVLSIDAALVVLADEREPVSAMATSAEFIPRAKGPCALVTEGPPEDAMRQGEPVGSADLRSETRWPAFTVSALNAGFAAVHALPLRLREERVGSLALLRHRAGGISQHDAIIGAAIADTASAALVSRRTLSAAQTLAGQLQTALNTRVTIEQAKGILAARSGSNVDAAFELMRSTARRNRRRLADVARDVVDDAPGIARLLSHSEPVRHIGARGCRRDVSSANA